MVECFNPARGQNPNYFVRALLLGINNDLRKVLSLGIKPASLVALSFKVVGNTSFGSVWTCMRYKRYLDSKINNVLSYDKSIHLLQ